MNRLNHLFRLTGIITALLYMVSCSKEVTIPIDDGGCQSNKAGNLSIVIKTPAPDDFLVPASRTGASGDDITEESGDGVTEAPGDDTAGGTVTAIHEEQEWTVKKLGVYIFMASAQSAADANYRLVKKTEGITFAYTGVPGETGIDNKNGTYEYTEPLADYMLKKYIKVLLVANEDKELGTANTDGISGTTLAEFKTQTASAVLQETADQSCDLISGGAPGDETYKGIVMSGVAKNAETEEIYLANAMSLNLDAEIERNVARIDICINKPGLTLKKAVLKNTSAGAYIFGQADSYTAPNAGESVKTYDILPTSPYADRLNGDSPAGIAFIPAEGEETEEQVKEKNTLKHVFYLYEKENIEADCNTVEIEYTLPDADGVEQTGILEIPFKTVTTEGEDPVTTTETYVHTKRNHLYTIELGDGSADGVVVLTRIVVQDWEPNIIEEGLDPSAPPIE